MSNNNPYKHRKLHVFIFYKNGTYKVHELSMANNKLASEKREKVLRFLPYDKTIKKFYVISGVNQTSGFKMKLDYEFNSMYGITCNPFRKQC